jgi:hypothetical protein
MIGASRVRLLVPDTITCGSVENTGLIPSKTHRSGAGVAVGSVGYADETANPHVGIAPAQSLISLVSVVQISRP